MLPTPTPAIRYSRLAFLVAIRYCAPMNTLRHLVECDGPGILDRLHDQTGINRKYLYQLATGRRRPSADLAKRLVDADSRLTIEGLLFPVRATSPLGSRIEQGRA